MSQEQQILNELTDAAYAYGFESDIEADMAPKGLTEETVQLISNNKNEPDWLLK